VLVQCASNLRQVTLGMISYAIEHKGFLPRFDTGSDTGRNAGDVAIEWYDTMRGTYKLPHDILFCPEGDDYLRTTHWNALPLYYIIGYAVWVPRRDPLLLFPPEPGAEPLHPVNGTESVRGPFRMGERIAQKNPVVATASTLDIASVVMRRRPPRFDMAHAVQSQFISFADQPLLSRKFDGANEGWIDGHVEWKNPARSNCGTRA
jgi:hypothetical protein